MATSGQGVLRRLLVVFEFGADTSKLDAGKKKLDSLFKDMQKVAAAFAGGAIARGVGHFVKDTVDEMMAIRKGAQELKITTDEMQQLRSASRATGMDVQWLHFTLERLEVNVERSTHGAKRQAEAMKLLGVKAHDAAGRVYSAKELFLQFAEGFEKITDQNKQARAVWDMMGRGAHRLLPLLRMGKERILELMQATEEYGKYQERDIELAAQYTITLEHLRLVWTGIKSFIMSQWLPMLGKQTEGIIKAGKWLHTMMKNSLLAKAALQVLQAAMVGLALKMAFAFPQATALLGVITALVVALDDLQVWWQGGESLIGAALDAIFGKGASTATLEKVKDIWRDISQFAALAWESAKKVLGIKDKEEAEYGPETPEAFAMRNRVAKRAEAKAAAEKASDTRYDAKTGLPIGSSKGAGKSMFDVLLKGARLGLNAGLSAPGMASDTLGRLMIGDFESRQPALVAPVSIGQVVVQTNTDDPQKHGEAVTEAIKKHMQQNIQDAAANLRREKQASGE